MEKAECTYWPRTERPASAAGGAPSSTFTVSSSSTKRRPTRPRRARPTRRWGGCRSPSTASVPLSRGGSSRRWTTSVAARTRPSPAIGRQRRRPPRSAPVETGAAGESRADGKAKARRSYPGTGWGNRVRDRARVVDFDPESNPVERITLRYEYRNALVALGVLPEASPWPGRLHERDSGRGFAEPPR